MKQNNSIEVRRLSMTETMFYRSLTLKHIAMFLRAENEDAVVAIGGLCNGKPSGLAIALEQKTNDGTEPVWMLLSFFVSEDARNKGLGAAMWDRLKKDIVDKGAKQLVYQAVLSEKSGEGFADFCKKNGAVRAEKLCRIYHYKSEDIIKSPFVKGAIAGNFKAGDDLRMISFKELKNENEYIEQIRENAGEWYPEFVSPFIGSSYINEECTIFAIDDKERKVAGWVTALDVNNDSQILYRTFFAREEYKNTQIGFYLFTEAIRRHMEHFPQRDGMASISFDNTTAIRFSELFFRGTCNRISYEWHIEWK